MQELIADLPLDDRPREKMRKHGPETLSDAELLAILLGSGTRGKNAIQLARELLRDGLGSLGRSTADAMAQTQGVGAAKATRIAAAFEIARRVTAPENGDGVRYDDSLVGRALVSRYAHESQEHLGAILLDPAALQGIYGGSDKVAVKRIRHSLGMWVCQSEGFCIVLDPELHVPAILRITSQELPSVDGRDDRTVKRAPGRRRVRNLANNHSPLPVELVPEESRAGPQGRPVQRRGATPRLAREIRIR